MDSDGIDGEDEGRRTRDENEGRDRRSGGSGIHISTINQRKNYEAYYEVSESVALSKGIQAELEVQATSAGETAYLPPLARRSRGQGGVMGKAADRVRTVSIVCWRTEYFDVPVVSWEKQ
jgi:hypothetical protein